MPVFGRETALSHRILGDVCNSILAGTHPGHGGADSSAVAWNLLHDSRVTDDWGEHWFTSFGSPTTPQGLANAFVRYSQRFRDTPERAYCDLNERAGNRAPRGNALPKATDLLVNVFDLWSYGSRIIWQHGAENRVGPLAGLSGLNAAVGGSMPPLLQRAFLSRDETHIVIRAYFDAQKDYLEEVQHRAAAHDTMATFGPCWVTSFDGWKSRVGDIPEDWCSAVGLHRKSGPLIAVVCYPAWRAYPLYRPTQLEAGWFGRHFPTPASCTTVHGGRVVEGRKSIAEAPGHKALYEYIHAPIALSYDDWMAAGARLLQLKHPVGAERDLVDDRQRHWIALRREFSDTASWMGSANPEPPVPTARPERAGEHKANSDWRDVCRLAGKRIKSYFFPE